MTNAVTNERVIRVTKSVIPHISLALNESQEDEASIGRAVVAPDGITLGFSVHGLFTYGFAIWNMLSQSAPIFVHGHQGGVNDVAFNPKQRLIATASWDGTVKIWDEASLECVKTLRTSNEGVFQVGFSRNGKYLASFGQGDGHPDTTTIWDLDTDRVILDRQDRDFPQLLWHPSKVWLALVRGDAVTVYDVERKRVVREFKTGNGTTTAHAAFTTDGESLVFATGQSVRQQSLADGREESALQLPDNCDAWSLASLRTGSSAVISYHLSNASAMFDRKPEYGVAIANMAQRAIVTTEVWGQGWNSPQQLANDWVVFSDSCASAIMLIDPATASVVCTVYIKPDDGSWFAFTPDGVLDYSSEHALRRLTWTTEDGEYARRPPLEERHVPGMLSMLWRGVRLRTALGEAKL